MRAFVWLILVNLLGFTFSARAEFSAVFRTVEQFNVSQSKRDCQTAESINFCPSALRKLVADDDKSRALVLESRAPVCRKASEYLNTSPTTAAIRNPQNFQSQLQKDRFTYLGAYSNAAIRRCALANSHKQNEVTAKFYYYASRLNAGAARIAQDRVIVAKLLGKSAPPCPDIGTLDHAHKSCEAFKACPNTQSLDKLAADVTLDESLYDEAIDKLKSLPKDCDKNEQCAKTKINLNGVIAGIQQKNPWFLDEAFNKDKTKKPIKNRLQTFLERTDKNLSELQTKVQNTSSCIHGSKNCQIDDMRETLSLMPELPEVSSRDLNVTYLNNQMAVQSCIEEGALDRNRTGSILNDTYLQAGVTIATLGVGAIFNGARVAGAAASARWAQLAVEVPNFSLDAYNAFLMAKEVKDACLSDERIYQFQEVENKNICENASSSLSPATRAHGSCLISAGLSGVSVLAFIPGGLRAGKLYQELKTTPSRPPTTATSGASTTSPTSQRTSDQVARSSQQEVLGSSTSGAVVAARVSTQTIQPKSVANLPEGIKILEGTNSEGKKVMYFQTREQLKSGGWIRSTREFQIDNLTGAIDANYPAGRELFERLAKSKAGAAHLAFFDVGSLGAVNKTFAGGNASGDRYIQAVAEKILKHGEGKVTLARTGGDEFALLIDETDPAKVQQLLSKIRDDLRLDVKGEGKAVFREEKIIRAEQYRANPSEENLARIHELSKIQQPDISIGSSQIGADDSLEGLLKEAEEQAKRMKIQTTLQFGRSAEKYGSKETPRARPNTMFRAEVEAPSKSRSWNKKSKRDQIPLNSNLREMKLTRVDELKRVGSSSVAKYQDELGRESYRLERYHTDPKTGVRELVTYEIPTRGQTGLLDGGHPESQKLILEHFKGNPDGVLVMPKLTSLRYLNYFESGTKAGDEMLEAVADAVKKQVREADLCFKLGGADFIMSLDKANPQELVKIQERINHEIMKSPGVKSVIEKERGLLNQKYQQAVKSGDAEAIATLKTKLSDLQNFKPQIDFQTMSRKEVNASTDFENIYNKFNQKFSKAAGSK